MLDRRFDRVLDAWIDQERRQISGGAQIRMHHGPSNRLADIFGEEHGILGQCGGLSQRF